MVVEARTPAAGIFDESACGRGVVSRGEEGRVMDNGYFGIGLYHAKNHLNVGSVLRAAGCFGASFVAVCGPRYKRAATDTMNAWKSVPLHHVEDMRAAIPFDCVPVAVELVEGAQPLCSFRHPPRAFYLLGGEDQTLGAAVLSWCRDVVYIPGGCLNMASASSIVLYDRVAKQRRAGLVDVPGAAFRRLKVV
jgi:tRNA(Leu) C34 or U34 (ribose-2'-O)-methylase TrmL